jgi:Transposase IS116/IS110/IS902 family
VLAKCGVQVLMSDLFGIEGSALLDDLRSDGRLPAPFAARVASLRPLIDLIDFEVDVFAGLVRGRITRDADLQAGYRAVQTIPGIGPTLAAVFLAEIGDVHRFTSPAKLACWAGLTPTHRESDTHVHRGRITKMGCGGRAAASVVSESAQQPGGRGVGRGWVGHSSSAVDVRLRGSGQR